MKTRHYVWVLLAVILTATIARAQTPQSPLPPPTGHVNDYVGAIDRATKAELETTLTNLDRQQGIQFAVVVVDTTGGQSIFDYSLAVARGWGLGSKDTQKPSLLLVVAQKDRNAFTQVSRHLEGDIPDGLAGQIQREKLVPAVRVNEYGRGIRDTLYEFIRTVASKQGFSTDKIFARGTRSEPSRARRPTSNTCISIIVLVVIALFVLGLVARGRGGRGGGGGGRGGWIAWMLMSMLLSGRSGSGSSGWSGGGFGGFSGGSGGGGGGSFGGFGGGGDFGGGGAGVSW